MSSWIVSNFWLIPAVPLAVSLVVLSLANPQRSIAALLAIFGQVVAFVLAIMAFLATLQMPGFRAVHNFIWFTFGDRKSTRLNSSHRCISYAVFCLKKKKYKNISTNYNIQLIVH